jgi:hypothetical protein
MIVAKRTRLAEPSTHQMLVFYRAPGEPIRPPADLVSLLRNEGLQTGTIQARNPTTHDQWWVPVVGFATLGLPYVAKAFAAVIQSWMKERRGRQVTVGKLRITGYKPADVERIVRALSKQERGLSLLHVTKAKPPRRSVAKKDHKKAADSK